MLNVRLTTIDNVTKLAYASYLERHQQVIERKGDKTDLHKW